MGTLPAWTPGVSLNRADKTVGEYLSASKLARWLSGMDADSNRLQQATRKAVRPHNSRQWFPFYPGRLMRSFRAFFAILTDRPALRTNIS